MSLSEIELHEGPWTEADYLALPEDGRRIELLDGGLLVSPHAGGLHQALALRLALALERARPGGMRVFETVNVRVGPGRILIPDIVVVRHSRLDFTVRDVDEVALVLEIVSPGSVTIDRAIKPRLYAEAGIPCYVRVEREGPTAIVGALSAGAYDVAAADTVLRLVQPFAVDIDLPALMAAVRSGSEPASYPRRPTPRTGLTPYPMGW